MNILLQAFSLRRICLFYLVALLTLGGASVYLDVAINDWYRVFYDALASKDLTLVIRSFYFFIAANLILAAITASNIYLSDILDAELRNAISLMLFANASQAERRFKDNDFPDQRIAEDVEAFTSRFAVIGISFFLMLCKAVVFFWILWLLSPKTTIFGLTIWGSLAIAASIYFIVPTVSTYLLGAKMYRYENKRRQAEARLRYSLISVLRDKKNARAGQFRRAMSQILLISKASLQINAYATFISFGFGSMSMLVPFGIMLPFYFAGGIDLGDVIKATAAFSIFQSSLAYLYSNSREVVKCIAALKRVELFHSGLLAPLGGAKF